MATNEQLVQQMYIAYYQRPADPDGLSYWVGKIEENGGWEAVAADFGNPANTEYAGLYGNLSRAELVEALYQSVFGRTAGEDEVAFWEASEHSDQYLGFAIINGAQNDDLALINKKVAFAELLVAEVDQAGYLALADVKAALADVTVDTNVADAVADLVADVSELGGLMADLNAANSDKADFLQAFAQKASLPATADVEAAVASAKTQAEGALQTAGVFSVAGDSDAVKAAKISDAKVAAADVVALRQKAVNEAQEAVSKVPGLASAIALVASRTNAQKAADKAVTVAEAAHASVVASYEKLFSGSYAADVYITDPKNAEKVVIDPVFAGDANISAAQKAEAAKVVATKNAELQAKEVYKAATDAVEDAKKADVYAKNSTEVDLLDSEIGLLQNAVDAQTTLNQQVAARDAALEAVSTLKGLNDAIDDAKDALEDAGYDLIELNASGIDFGTAADDVFFAGNLAAGQTATVNSFSVEGNDQLFIGTEYTLNSGTLANGDNTVLEVFFIQNGLNTEVTLETKAFGSASTAEQEVVITLLGVDASDLVLSDEGFISVA